MDVLKIVKSALPYAGNASVRESLDKLIDTHSSDLEEVGYTSSDDTEDAAKELLAAMNELDDEMADHKEAIKEAMKEAKDEEDDGE